MGRESPGDHVKDEPLLSLLIGALLIECLIAIESISPGDNRQVMVRIGLIETMTPRPMVADDQ